MLGWNCGADRVLAKGGKMPTLTQEEFDDMTAQRLDRLVAQPDVLAPFGINESRSLEKLRLARETHTAYEGVITRSTLLSGRLNEVIAAPRIKQRSVERYPGKFAWILNEIYEGMELARDYVSILPEGTELFVSPAQKRRLTLRNTGGRDECLVRPRYVEDHLVAQSGLRVVYARFVSGRDNLGLDFNSRREPILRDDKKSITLTSSKDPNDEYFGDYEEQNYSLIFNLPESLDRCL